MAYYSKKICKFCAEHIDFVDYKDIKLLQRYLNSYGKIESRKRSGNCMKHQRMVTTALKRARHLALLPFVVR